MTESSTSRPPFQTTTPGPLASAGTPSGTPAAVPDAYWSAIEDDLAARGVTAEPTLISSENVSWPDGSLGCATPGQMYTQAVVDGMRVVVEADGTSFDFRFGADAKPTLCEGYTPGALRSGPGIHGVSRDTA